MASAAERWPNLFVIGAMRAGTTSLYQVLRSHPEIYMAPVKEPNFFADPKYKSRTAAAIDTPDETDGSAHRTVVEDESAYLNLFRDARNARYRGEASPSYLPSPGCAQRIRRMCEKAMFIVVLRDPIARAISHYQMDVGIGRVSMSFEQAIEAEFAGTRIGSDFGYLETGRYWHQLGQWRAANAGHLFVTSSSEMKDDASAVLTALAAFLGVQPFDESVRPVSNLGASPRFALLNRIAYRTGAKALLRRALPSRWKERAKESFYRPADSIPMLAPSTAERLREYYRRDVEAVEAAFSIDLAEETRQ